MGLLEHAFRLFCIRQETKYDLLYDRKFLVYGVSTYNINIHLLVTNLKLIGAFRNYKGCTAVGVCN